MKPPKKKKPIASKETHVEKGDLPGTVKVWHSQEIKQSRNYGNGCSASYGMQLTVLENEEAIEKGIVMMEETVEKFLAAKYKEQKTLMDKISPEL